MKIAARLSALVLLVPIATGSACSSGESSAESGAAALSTGCDVVAATDGHSLSQAELASLGDPIAKLILSGDACPKTFPEVQAKLEATDPCRAPTPEAPAGEPGVATRFVSERSAILGVPDEYRSVTSRQCQGRQVHELLMSVFAHAGAGGDIDTATVGEDSIELIGEKRDATNPDAVSGIFNFYTRENGRWTFFGGSDDLVSQGYDCNADGACVPKAAAKQRCAGCHVGGGLVMKELSNPWTFWGALSRSVPIVGMVPLAAKFPKLFGRKLNGSEMEQAVIRPGNVEWTRRRVEVLKKKGLKELLRPLFCTLDMNLETPTIRGTDAGVPFISVLNERTLLDSIWLDRPRVPGDGAWDKAEKGIGQRVIDSATGKPFERNGEVVRSSSIPVIGALSLDHRARLLEVGIVDEDFVKDILAVDLTRPIYSKTRCDLVERLPDLAEAQMQPGPIKRAVAEALASASGAAEAFRKSVLDENDAPAHDKAAQAFLDACVARQASEADAFATDVVRYLSHVRNATRRAGGIIETPEMLAVDDLADAPRAFDAKTCKLVE